MAPNTKLYWRAIGVLIIGLFFFAPQYSAQASINTYHAIPPKHYPPKPPRPPKPPKPKPPKIIKVPQVITKEVVKEVAVPVVVPVENTVVIKETKETTVEKVTVKEKEKKHKHKKKDKKKKKTPVVQLAVARKLPATGSGMLGLSGLALFSGLAIGGTKKVYGKYRSKQI